MTAKEFYDQTVTYENDFDFRTVNLMSNYKGIICDLLNEYARTMCQKQKEICAEEAETIEEGYFDPNDYLDYQWVVNEDSILNSPFPEELQDEN